MENDADGRGCAKKSYTTLNEPYGRAPGRSPFPTGARVVESALLVESLLSCESESASPWTQSSRGLHRAHRLPKSLAPISTRPSNTWNQNSGQKEQDAEQREATVRNQRSRKRAEEEEWGRGLVRSESVLVNVY